MKSNTALAGRYRYTVIEHIEDGETCYKVIIPKFPNIWIMTDTHEKIHPLVLEEITEMIEVYKKEGTPIPPPDLQPNKKFSGKFVLRVAPETHQLLVKFSQAEGKTLNQYINDIIAKKVAPRNRCYFERTRRKK